MLPGRMSWLSCFLSRCVEVELLPVVLIEAYSNDVVVVYLSMIDIDDLLYLR